MAERLQANDLNDLAIFDAVETAGKLLAEGSVSTAKSSVEKVLKSDPKNAEAMQILGVCFYQMGEIYEAEERFKFIMDTDMYVRRSPGEVYADAYNGLALCANHRGFSDLAIDLLKSAIERNPSSFFHDNLALCQGKPVKRVAPRILVGSLFAGDDEFQERWLDLQLKFLRNTTPEFNHVVCLDKSSGSASFREKTIILKVRDEPTYYPHIWGLRQLADHFRSVKGSYDYFLILDSDAFPIKINWMNHLLSKMSPKSCFDDKGLYLYSHGHDYEIASIIRNENFESRLHASVLFMKKKSLDYIDFEHDFVTVDALNCREKDVCLHTYQFERKNKGFPLIRTNKTNIHPVIGGVYYDSFYHHGGGRPNYKVQEDVKTYSSPPVFRSDMYHDYVKSHDAQFYADSLLENPEEFVANLAGWNKEKYVR